MSDAQAKRWQCEIDGPKGKETLAVIEKTDGSWIISSDGGATPWIPSPNGCFSFSSEAAAMSVYNHVCGAHKWQRR